MTHGWRWLVGLGLGAAMLAGFVPAAGTTAAAQERPTEAEELRARARDLFARLPEMGRRLLNRELEEWDALDGARRGRLERWIDLLLPLGADTLAQMLAPAAAAPSDQRMQKTIAILDNALIVGPPAGLPNDYRVVIVCVGGGTSTVLRAMVPAFGADAATHPLMPATVSIVRPWGMLLTKFSAKIPRPDLFLGVLLQGRSPPRLDPRGGSKVLATPSIGEMYRKHVGKAKTARDVWVIYRDADLVADFSTAKNFGEKYYQIALIAHRLHNRANTRLSDEVLDYRKEKKSPFDISRAIHGLSAAKLNVDTMFTDRRVKEFIRGQVSHASGPGINSDVFVARATADLLRSTIDPRIVIARLGRPTPDADGRVSNKQRDAFVRDTDRHIGMIWSASRASDRWRGRTYFWLIVENSSLALVCGPGIPPGTRSSASAKLSQVVPTVAKMLGLVPSEMVTGAKGTNKKPIEVLFPAAPVPPK